MIKLATSPVFEILDNLPKNFSVLDVGGASAPFKRATHMVDIVPWSRVYIDKAKGLGEVLFNEESYTQFDICFREKWPFSDKQFDYSVCSHVLEDIRDPLWVCSELIRTSKSGYIEIPSRLYETTFGVEVKNLAGASHHRWVIDLHDSKLRFTFKYMHIHSKVVNKNRGKYKNDNSEMVLRLEWSDTFNYFENWLNSGQEIFEFYLNRPISEKQKWAIYRDTQNRALFIRQLAYIKNVHYKKLPFIRKILNFFWKKLDVNQK